MNSSTSGWVILTRKPVAGSHPQNDNATADGEERDELWSLDAACKGLQVEVPDGDARNGRESLPIESILQHRRVWSRGAQVPTRCGRSFKLTFVDKHYGSAFGAAGGLFYRRPA